jgi:hypothetical protein
MACGTTLAGYSCGSSAAWQKTAIWTSRLSPCGHPLHPHRYVRPRVSATKNPCACDLCPILAATATGSPRGDQKGTRVQDPGCPCNCERRAIGHMPLGIFLPEKAVGPALTRKPGDLPDAVVFRADRVCGPDEDVPRIATELLRRAWPARPDPCCAMPQGRGRVDRVWRGGAV